MNSRAWLSCRHLATAAQYTVETFIDAMSRMQLFISYISTDYDYLQSKFMYPRESRRAVEPHNLQGRGKSGSGGSTDP